jgi:hypothetical protein
MGSRPGPVKEQIAAFQERLTAMIHRLILIACEQHELSADEDPTELTFELNGIILAANANFVLRDNPTVLDMASKIVRRRLGVAPPTAADSSARRRSDQRKRSR